MSQHDKTQVATPEIVELVGVLEKILRAQYEDYKKIANFIELKQEAIRNANMQEITGICQDEHVVAQHATQLEKQRLLLTGELTSKLQPNASEPLTVSQIAEVLEDPDRQRILELATQLKQTVKEVRQASSIVHKAADVLSAHMGGLLQTMQSVLSKAQVYSQKGRISVVTQSQYCLDLKS